MPRPLDEILGLKKTAAKHDLEIGDEVKLLPTQLAFEPGKTGVIAAFDEWNRARVVIDGVTARYTFHHSHLEKI